MSRILLFISCFFVYTGKASRKKKENGAGRGNRVRITAADEKMRISKSAVVSRSDEFIRKYKKTDKRSLY
ncbi:hypothetical protein DXA34_08175 [[Clostridium] symbiosum]|jgi:hypothetical protein|nr:hypothetical protein DXA34_08175 [[Clostridium] symbiosum]RHB67076.1 hypothetical protein DW877_00060 [[Clostridium] symbiosum]